MTQYSRVPLGEVCLINPRVTKNSLPDEATPVSFVPMAAVDEVAGQIQSPEVRALAEVSKGFTAFQDEDVIFAKITPCMENGKAALARGLQSGIGRGSTEFHVLRAGDRVLPELIYHYVRWPKFRADAKRHFTGTAGQQRVPKSFLENALIPLPPIEEQRRIVDILNRAASIERLRAQAQAKLREFIPALFIKMFGDPLTNPMGWEVRPLGEIADVQGGLQVSRKRASNPIEVPYLRVANVYRDLLNLDEIKAIRVQASEQVRTQLRPGDLLIVEGHGNALEVGRTAIWDGSIEPCVHQNHLIRARPNPAAALPEFVSAVLNSASGRRHLVQSGKTTSGLSTISASNVKSCPVIVPPIAEQRSFRDLVKTAGGISEVGHSATVAANTLTASLMSKLFGEAA